MARYRKKPVIIEAVQWNGRNEMEVAQFAGGNLEMGDDCLIIPTLEGKMHASIGDYIIKGVRGEIYPCHPEIFEQTYESIEENVVLKPAVKPPEDERVGKHELIDVTNIPRCISGAYFHGELWVRCPQCHKAHELVGKTPYKVVGKWHIYKCECGQQFKA